MQTFERSVLIVALLILIVTLAVMGIALKQNAGKGPGPAAECPDFWFSSFYEPCKMSQHGCCDDEVTPANADGTNCGTGDCLLTENGCCPDGFTAKNSLDGANCPAPGPAMCYNVNGLPKPPVNGECKIKNPADFKAQFGNTSLCSKQTWAKRCSVSWDGVTNVDNDCS
jgi:hypothetical protein